MKRSLLTVLALLVLILLAGTLGCGTHNAVEREASTIDDTALNTAVELYIKQKTVTDETDEFTVSYVNKTDTDYSSATGFAMAYPAVSWTAATAGCI